MNEVSFMSEHSVEYLLAHKICTYLKKNNIVATPLFFWSTREGNKMGRECFKDKMIRILAIYPRRPKVMKIYDDTMRFKINSAIIPSALYLYSSGIPVFVGGPLISSLDEFQMDSKVFIAKLNKQCITEDNLTDEYFQFDKSGKLISEGNQFVVTGMDDVKNAINDKANFMRWSDAIDII